MNLKQSIFEINEFCKWHNSVGYISTNDEKTINAIACLGEIKDLLESEINRLRYNNLRVEISKGAGKFPKVPWVCILQEGQKVSNGIYVSICFSKDGNGLIAGLAKSHSNKKNLETVIRTSSKRKVTLEDEWNVNVDGVNVSTKYNNTFYNPKEFFVDENFDELLFLGHIRKSLDIYVKTVSVYNSIKSKTLYYEKYTLPSGNKEFNSLLATCLLAKPFVILTGSSGTGKTKQAKDLAKHFSKDAEGSNYEVVPVGADWTDNRATLGFVNHLTQEGKPIYQSTPIVNLLLRASKDLNTPYFLILDEMNLSHVERYFADFLSVMEQKNGVLKLHSEGKFLENSAKGEESVPYELDYPTNLFVIGTVNIDETTYMFSPKVLDRANVLEYKVSEEELGEFLLSPSEPADIAQADDGQAEQFLALSRAVRDIGESRIDLIKEAQLKGVQEDVMKLFNIMEARRFEFAFRTANEMSRYLKVSRHLSADQGAWDEEGWRISLDEQILQKVLPKLHGSIGRVGKLIAQLAHFAYDPKATQYKDVLSDVRALGTNDDGSKPVFPQSLAKLKEMAETLREEQFVSFI